ncbi:MAG: glycosyltransferase, partial [Desulfobacteraceae bacterium]
LKSYCRAHALSSIVFFAGFSKDVHAFMQGLDLLIMPSLREGLPLTLLEAMYLKVPVIASNVGGIKEVLTNDHDGVLVPPKDPKILAEKILELYRNPGKRSHIADNAYAKVSSSFLAGAMVEKYLRVYNEILD